jgi:hypothetical protein
MAVYVDRMRAPYRGMVMCHMIADTHAELMAMAARLGLDPSWLQKAGTPREHFDLAASKRRLAVHDGAQEISRKTLVQIISRKCQEPWHGRL